LILFNPLLSSTRASSVIYAPFEKHPVSIKASSAVTEIIKPRSASLMILRLTFESTPRKTGHMLLNISSTCPYNENLSIPNPEKAICPTFYYLRFAAYLILLELLGEKQTFFFQFRTPICSHGNRNKADYR
jgi:hypothetical protein